VAGQSPDGPDGYGWVSAALGFQEVRGRVIIVHERGQRIVEEPTSCLVKRFAIESRPPRLSGSARLAQVFTACMLYT
jgi:hypothetical protein